MNYKFFCAYHGASASFDFTYSFLVPAPFNIIFLILGTLNIGFFIYILLDLLENEAAADKVQMETALA